MNPEKTITICDTEVRLRYCAATETGYEQLSGKSTDIFVPTILERDEKGQPTKIEPPHATGDDYLKLAIAAMTSAYAYKNEVVPITVDKILYEAGPQEVTLLITTVIDLRNKWYQVPEIIKKDELATEEGEEKNA